MVDTQKSVGNDCVIFEVNKERFEVSDVDPSTTLLEFLRTRTHIKSAKLSCGEGGCGACVVLLSKYNPALDEVESFNINSCLTLLCSVNGCSITTSEGLGNSKDGFHPVHQRFAGFHASQCGFCTPGMCMSFYSALVNSEKKNSKLTVPEAEKSIMGNICRCTGYRPIADACKSFAADVDLEDLGVNCFWRKGDAKEVKAGNLPAYNPKEDSCLNSEMLKDKDNSTRPLNSERLAWYSPVSIEELQSLLYSDTADTGARIKLVVGNTGNGYFKETEKYDKYIDLRYIPELSVVKLDYSAIEFGAALSISKVILNLREKSKANPVSGGDLVFSRIADHTEKVASGFIRNSGSLGGNLVMAQKKHFPSDIATVLLAAGASVTILTSRKYEKITMDEFLGRPPLDSKSVLLSVHIPFLEPAGVDGSDKTTSKLLFETYRAAPRPHGNALPYLNAAFLADISCDKNGTLVNKIRLAFGAYGTKHATRAKKVEEFLGGKMLTVGVVNETMKLVKGDVVCEEGTSHAAYRSTLAVSFLFAFFNSFSSIGSVTPNGSSKDFNGSLLEWVKVSVSGEVGNVSVSFEETCLEGAEKTNNGGNISPKSNLPLVSSAKQVMESSQDYYPVGKPLPKYGASIQASGEAVYVDDIPSPPNCLHGAFIYTTKPMARVKSISFESNSQPSEIAAVVSAKDIPGENIGCIATFASESLFADDISRCAGDLLAFVVAKTQKKANMAAKMAVIDYDLEGLDPPILTVEEAVEKSSFFDVPPSVCPEEVGDFSKGMAEADHKILSAEIKLGPQYYFYMETQTALAIPDEDNCMVVYSSNQNPELAHTVIAKCLGLPEHNVRVITRRVGGGFGGKAMKSMHVAAACALAAHKLRRPVRVYVDRQTDMIVTGARHPMKITYSVGFKSNGQITALHLDILIDAGITEDISPLMPMLIVGSLKKYNWGALSFDIKVCKTNYASKTAMRAPGDLQGSYIAEAIIEHVASFLSMEVDSVRSKNFHSYKSLKLFHGSYCGESVEFTLPSIWDKLATSSSFVQRTEAIEQFNRSNKWRKRGISRVPIVYDVTIKETPGKVSILKDGSVVVETGGIELGQGLWTKVRQATAYALSLIKCEGTENLIDKVRVVQADTLSVIQGGVTSGSTKSESSCAAVKLCCDVLVKRLAPLKEKLQRQMGSVTWDVLILQAHTEFVNLAANSMYSPEASVAKYLNYGAAVSEVEVNILTGETSILRTDLVYDCGQSLNPATDLGQIEGSFVQGIGFFMLEEYLTNSDGLTVSDSTWTYKVPTLDNIPKQFNVEVLNSGQHKNQILSSKASGEPPLLLASSVHCATRAAIKAARKQLKSWGAVEGTDSTFQLDVPATLPVVKKLCGLNTVETYLECLLSHSSG